VSALLCQKANVRKKICLTGEYLLADGDKEMGRYIPVESKEVFFRVVVDFLLF